MLLLIFIIFLFIDFENGLKSVNSEEIKSNKENTPPKIDQKLIFKGLKDKVHYEVSRWFLLILFLFKFLEVVFYFIAKMSVF